MAAGERPADPGSDPAVESRVVQRIEGNQNLQVAGDLSLTIARRPPQPVYLIAVIRKLEEVLPLPPQGNKTLISFDIDRKITFNEIERYRNFIQQASTDFYTVDGAYDALAVAAYPTAKIFIQRYLRSQYRNLRAQDPTRSSDEILERLIAELKALARDAEGVPPELISDCCDIIVAHAFVECTVLESPSHAHRP